MDAFTIGLITLSVVTVIFFIVLFSFIFYWHLVKVSFLVVPLVFTFEFFVMGLCLISIVSIILKYVPELVRAAGI